jgi:predicted DNA-binding transcriptional regulator AlpA
MIDSDNFKEAVANGDTVLFGIEQICEKLCMSRSSFIRLRSIVDPVETTKPYFPPPDVTIGRSPRWTSENFNKWIAKVIDYNKRNILPQYVIR